MTVDTSAIFGLFSHEFDSTWLSLNFGLESKYDSITCWKNLNFKAFHSVKINKCQHLISQLFFQKLVADMLLIQTYSNKMLPSLMQKKEPFGAEQVKEVKLLEEKSHQYGIKLQSLLQVCGFHKFCT